MNGKSIAVNRAMVAVIIVAVALLGFSAAAYIESIGPSTTPQSSTSAAAFNQTTGLSLRTRLSANEIDQGQNLTVSVSVTNALFIWNDVPPGFDFPMSLSPYSFSMSSGCSPLQYGFVVLAGNYSSSNFENGHPLTVLKPVMYSCPVMEHIGYYQFLPHSSKAKLYSTPAETNYLGTTDLSGSLAFSGYWTGNFSSPTFHTFAPGTYTIVSADEWGDTSILHFDVH